MEPELVPSKSAKKKQVPIRRPEPAKAATEPTLVGSEVDVNRVGSKSAAEGPGQPTEEHAESQRPSGEDDPEHGAASESTPEAAAGQKTEPPSRESDFYQTVNVPDSATPRDTLGFEPYV